LKEACIKDAIKRSVLRQQLRGAIQARDINQFLESKQRD
jgi:hypothetical protein